MLSFIFLFFWGLSSVFLALLQTISRFVLGWEGGGRVKGAKRMLWLALVRKLGR